MPTCFAAPSLILAEAVTISDFAHYPPSGNAPAGFAGHAIEKDGKVIGVFAVQVPAEPLNALMRFTAGMGDTGGDVPRRARMA